MADQLEEKPMVRTARFILPSGGTTKKLAVLGSDGVKRRITAGQADRFARVSKREDLWQQTDRYMIGNDAPPDVD